MNLIDIVLNEPMYFDEVHIGNILTVISPGRESLIANEKYLVVSVLSHASSSCVSCDSDRIAFGFKNTDGDFIRNSAYPTVSCQSILANKFGILLRSRSSL